MPEARVKPNNDGTYDIEFDDPSSPMEWQGGIIEPKDGKWVWTLYCGFTDKTGEPRSYKLPSLFWQLSLDELMNDSLESACEQLLQCWHNPCLPLKKALDEAGS